MAHFKHFQAASPGLNRSRMNPGYLLIHGVDIFTLDETGKAKELTVMLRPEKALTVLGEIEDKFIRELLDKKPGS